MTSARAVIAVVLTVVIAGAVAGPVMKGLL